MSAWMSHISSGREYRESERETEREKKGFAELHAGRAGWRERERERGRNRGRVVHMEVDWGGREDTERAKALI